MQKWSFIFLLFIALFSTAQERQFVVWNKNGVAVAPWEKVTLEVSQKVHYSPEQNSVTLKYGEVFMEYEPKNGLEYGFGFRHSKSNAQKGNGFKENRAMLYFTLSREIKNFELSFLNRLEYRTFKIVDDYLRHKQSLKLDFPNITTWGMKFYISEESFLKLNGTGTHMARFYTGLKALDKTHFDMKVYYVLQKTKGIDYWGTSDIVGVNLNFSI